ncbi:hypothetical protein [Chromatocurvus halotolerans]|uniref:Uncharacterized protein n=1 Tax=Chromatocurvus halotolerans TaxID=1132028 RepID=A0A4R2L0G1_9GAMM|nr:hypothetical protein [Chromatocurvus halotolerans]TCO77259.1 hypothetical protein EV688_103274 [Chromatocurvus halotolerans]
MDSGNAVLLTFGLATLFVSWILLLIVAWTEDYAWGLFALLLPPLAYLYGLFRLDKAGQSLLVAAAGLVMIWAAL